MRHDGHLLPSTDSTEIAAFNKLAEQWWDPTGPMAPLHGLNQLRVPYILEQLQAPSDVANPEPATPYDVLDIGCGAGLLSEGMARHGYSVTGIDPAERNIAIARQHATAHGLDIDYQHTVIEHLPARQFAVVLNMEVVEHVPNAEAFLADSAARVAPGGWLFIATINRTLAAFLAAIVGAEWLFNLLPRGTHRWQQFVRPSEVRSACCRAGLIPVVSQGVAVNPIGPRFRLTRYTGVNYMLVFRRPFTVE